MSDRLPPVTGPQLIRILERKGWYVKRSRGSHFVMRHPEIPDAIPVPAHGGREIKRGTLHSILRVAGISREELRRLLR